MIRPSSHASRATLALLIAATAACSSLGRGPGHRDRDWPVTGGERGNSRFSELAQIDRGNVSGLRVAWVYRANGGTPRGQIQATPIVVDGVLYSTGAGKVFALRGESGEEIWSLDLAAMDPAGGVLGANRGVVYWADGPDRRIIVTAGRRIWALDAATGKPISTFGQGGWADLGEGLGREASGQPVASSPGMVYRDLLIQTSRVSEAEDALPGHVRAYDLHTGKLRWIFHTIPQPGELGYDSWPAGAYRTAGGANSWTGMALDERRGIVFVPTGSASPDFWGGGRAGQNLFANSLIALNAATGERIWHFQTVHHDVLDRDLPAPPNLVTIRRDGRSIDAVAQITKQGFVFLFDRETGVPLFPVEERAVPASSLPGEPTWPTQPFPTKPAPFARQTVTEADLTDLSPEAHAQALARYRTLRQPTTLFTPPSLEGSVVFPGFDGGGEWGGAAVDPRSAVLYVNASDVPWVATMTATERTTSAAPRSGAQAYAATCAPCHGADRRGDGNRVPSLVAVGARLSAAQIRQLIDQGRGFMPPVPGLTDAEKAAVVAHLLGQPEAGAGYDVAVMRAGPPPPPYRFKGYEKWKDSEGYPAVKPPWGTLNAIDLNTGEYLWKVPLGETPALKARGLPTTGTEQYGGPIVTAGGLVFIGATMDEKFRALDARTGQTLWEAQLPAAGYATPSTYSAKGRQFVVIAAGGGKLGTKSSDAYVAFALPE